MTNTQAAPQSAANTLSPCDVAEHLRTSEEMAASGLGRESLYRALCADGNSSLATVLKVIRDLGLRLHAEALVAES
jgi:DNA-binding phage protein